MSIHNLAKKINPLAIWMSFPEKVRIDVLFILILILVGTLSFGIGRLSKVLREDKPVNVLPSVITSVSTSTRDIKPTPANSIETATSTVVVASSKGTKYHYPWCSGAKTISAKNKISFKTPELAQKAGYTLAANCK